MAWSLAALGLARDNHGTETPTTLKQTGGDGNPYSLSQYEVTSASLSGNQIPLDFGTYDYTITLSGGSRKGELQNSARLNVAYVLCGDHQVVSVTNTTIQITFNGNDTNPTLYVDWGDTFNPTRNAQLSISVG